VARGGVCLYVLGFFFFFFFVFWVFDARGGRNGSQWLRWRRVAVVAVAGGVCGWWVCGGLLEDLWVMAGFG
jgi:hypothetical protein